MTVDIIGAGFAGVEAGYYLANRDIKVNIHEMRDKKMTPVHKTGLFAELVCSNSFKAINIDNAHGLLKKELELLDSIVIKTAYKSSVPAGGALAVDRDKFAESITKIILDHPNINFVNEEIISLDKWINTDNFLIIATGPMTSEAMNMSIKSITGNECLFFFDAASPIINADTIDYNKVFFQSRYDKGTDDYLNAPFTKDQYINFVDEIKKSQKLELHNFENKKVFEGCIPVEVLAERGIDTLAFGPMKPVGLKDPKSGKQPYAVVQMRMENVNKSMFNLVGFQTRMKWDEQKRIFRMIPGLENVEFLRYGVIHKNTFLDLPKIIDKNLYSLKMFNNIYFAGQMTGVEGYIESAASGLFTANSIYARINNKNIFFPKQTMIGALQNYTITENNNYQPMASNFGLIDRIVLNEKGKPLKKKEKKLKLAEESLNILSEFIK